MHVSGDQYRPEIHVAVVVKLILAMEQLNWGVITVCRPRLSFLFRETFKIQGEVSLTSMLALTSHML